MADNIKEFRINHMEDWKNCPGYLIHQEQGVSLAKEMRDSNRHIEKQLDDIRDCIKENKESGDIRATKLSDDIIIIKEGMKNFVWLKRIIAATYITGMGGLIFWIVREIINHLNG